MRGLSDLDRQEIAIVKGMLRRGDRQSDIAAFFAINSGRIAEVNTGQCFADIEPAIPDQLPEPGPYMAAREALAARDALLAIRLQIDICLQAISNGARRDVGNS